MTKDQLFGFIKHHPKGVTWKQIRMEHQFVQFQSFKLLDVLDELIQEGKIEHKKDCYKHKKQSTPFH